MKAIQCVQWGGPEQLRLAECALPEPAAGEVRIRVEAAGVNFPDALIIQRKYQLQPPLPFVPGTEVAGTVDAASVASPSTSVRRSCRSRPCPMASTRRWRPASR